MASLEELRQKRLQELKGGNSSSSLNDIRAKRITELKSKKSTFTEKPQEIQDAIDTGSTAGEAFRRTAAVNTLPTVGGIGAGAAAGALGGSVVPGIGTVVGFIGGAIAGAILTKKAQDKVLEVTMGEEWKRNLDQSLAEDRKAHPYATLIGEAAPSLITFRPSPSTLKQAFNLSKRALTDTKSLSSHVKTLQGKTELDALINVGVGAGVDVSLETYQQAREGDINALRIIGAAVLGGTISDPNRIGVKLGFKPSGDAVIEEYDKFGSKTPAAKVVTHGDIPVIDRSTDGIVIQRRELSAILRGEAEANRFTEPRILQAERIAGTIDKDVTPDSDLNVYRLDGRSGAMRVGERVTANPHIADVFGGRINPEATVKAGDLVRTSQGDYVYIPKSAIAEQPKLPPVTAAVEPAIRTEVKAKERSIIKETKAKEAEAKRLAEEPARLQREAEALAVKERVRAEKAYASELKQAEIAKIKLIQEAEKTRKATMKRVIQEKKRVETEKTILSKNLDKEIESVTVKLRKDISAAILDHNKRLAKATTKLQKSKEQIRFTNKKAALTAKAIKDKKALREKTASAIKNIKNDIPNIKKQSEETIKELEAKAKSIPKPELKKVEPVVRPDFAKSKKTSSKLEEKDKILYHGGSKLTDIDLEKSRFQKTFYMSDNTEYAKSYGGKNSVLNRIKLSSKANLADMRNPSAQLVAQIKKLLLGEETGKIIKIPKPDGSFVEVPEIKGAASNSVYSNTQIIKGIEDGKAMFAELPEVKDILQKLGYDGQITTESEYGSNYGIWNKDVIQVENQKPDLVTKTTTIGTKVVKSESLIKNAIKEAENTSKKAQELDVDVTDQMGTTFVEQRKLAAEVLAEKGFDDALTFALDASDAAIRKLNLDRSSLYETLYKTAVRDGQFAKYHDELEELAVMVSDEVSAAAQKSSLHRLATENDPFRRVATLKKTLLEKEKKIRGSVFTKEVDELYAKLKAAGSEEDINKIIKDNLC